MFAVISDARGVPLLYSITANSGARVEFFFDSGLFKKLDRA